MRAPGRVNLIGEHTDYNDGFVLPMAIDRAVWIAARPRDDRRVVVHSVDFEETAEFSLDGLKHEDAGWVEYLKGTASILQQSDKPLTGWEGVLMGDVPLGAGLSSSAALEMATARVFAAVGSLSGGACLLGMVIAGPIADAFGVSVWFVAAGVISALMGVAIRATPAVMRIEEDAAQREKANGVAE